ncbi:sodium transporter [Iodidimonas nitroreducens]|uniref:Sodium transporter n=1 Tax=Iodidimonas nitroreducens TaxID=1236968 RepID=A0A5A7NAL5_9PROT|nr:sodium/sugar symporter [Iodidimonas nitroreducens]GAK33805.1 sodium/glucose cotransporter [alpha proteobacterium Q-1]GER04774.1 sodium transporter [Iodidimonas nitroreducens]
MLSSLDYGVLAVYAIAIFSLAQYVSREKAGHQKDSGDYFLAGKSLPWWAIGASLIAANISAEQIIGMSGSGYVLGLAIASYEWMAAITLIIVGKYFLPIFLRNNISTMPQFLEKRFDHRVRVVLAVFWLGVYVFVNLTAVIWLGGLAIHTVTGADPVLSLVGLGIFAGAYSLYGGLKAVALTDIFQVVLLVFGGLLIAYIALDTIADGRGVLAGFGLLLERFPEKFDMILSPDNPNYKDLPGISVLIGGMWIMNLSYWGFNQYVIQRALAAKSLREAQKGIAFAAYLKLLMPVIVVLPGMAALILAPDLKTPDQAYPAVMSLLPAGIMGLVFAALVAAIISSLGSMTNSIATIFTLDIYAPMHKAASQKKLVMIGRIVSVTALLTAMITARPLLGQFDQAFQYIQEFTGFFTPGIVVIFLLGMFWPRANAAGALSGAIGSAALSLGLKLFWPALPFIDRVGLVFLLCLGIAAVVSLAFPDKTPASQIELGDVDYKTSGSFNVATIGVLLILAALYAVWW